MEDGVVVKGQRPAVRRGELFSVCFFFTGSLALLLLTVVALALFFTVLFTPFAVAALRRVVRCGFVGDVNFTQGALRAGWWRAMTVASLVLLSPVAVVVWCVCFTFLSLQAVFFYPFMLVCALCVPLPPTVGFFAEFHYSYTQAVKFSRALIVAVLIPTYEPLPVSGSAATVTPLAETLRTVAEPPALRPTSGNRERATADTDLERRGVDVGATQLAASAADGAAAAITALSKSGPIPASGPFPGSAGGAGSSGVPSSESGSRRTAKSARPGSALPMMMAPLNPAQMPLYYPGSGQFQPPGRPMMLMPDGSVHPLPAAMGGPQGLGASYTSMQPRPVSGGALPYGAMSASLPSFNQPGMGQLVQTPMGLQYMYVAGTTSMPPGTTYTGLADLAVQPPNKRKHHRHHRDKSGSRRSEPNDDDKPSRSSRHRHRHHPEPSDPAESPAGAGDEARTTQTTESATAALARSATSIVASTSMVVPPVAASQRPADATAATPRNPGGADNDGQEEKEEALVRPPPQPLITSPKAASAAETSLYMNQQVGSPVPAGGVATPLTLVHTPNTVTPDAIATA